MNVRSGWERTPFAQNVRKYAAQPRVAKAYLVASLGILGGSTLLWSLLGARLQQSNADQLVNPYLYQTAATWRGALLPDQHTFLIKWPLFYVVKLFGYSTASFEILTAVTVLLTISLFAWLLSRTERRPLALGTIYLALSSVLLLVPAQPYAGGLLPVGMAMLTTRNLEYILYIVGLYFIIKATRYRSRRFLAGAVLLTLLLASDKLFLSVSIGGALLALIVYSVRQRWQWVSVSARWLVGSLGAAALAVGLLALVNDNHAVHIAAQAVAGPYSVNHTPKSLVLGSIYAVGGFLTNFGANPAFDALTLRQIPHQMLHHLLTPAGPAFVINMLVVLFGVLIGSRLLLVSAGFLKSAGEEVSTTAERLAIVLLWATIAVCGLFVVTNHYYVVDARYLTLGLFSVFLSLAVWASRQTRLRVEPLVASGGLLLVAVVCGTVGTLQIHNTQTQALTTVNHRDTVISQTLSSHHAKTLVGDYWRVIPTKALSKDSKQQVLPLANCTKPRTVLTSRAWQPDLHTQSFAYLLTFNGSLTDYPDCTLDQVTTAYGLPNSSALIAGSLAHPDEVLLFYDHGIHHPKKPVTKAQTTAAVLPVALGDLVHTNCQTPTVMNIVAHEDDDLLFMNPDLLHDVKAGHCVRSVYLTAGDAGAGLPYWLSREQGSEAAYGEMIGGNPTWIQRIVQLPGGQFITVDNPRGNGQISLIFMHLPDGNVHGDGFGASHHESLASLLGGHLSAMQTVDQQSSYTSKQLVAALTALLHTYQPSEIRTQSNNGGTQYPDHSDHRAVGQFAAKAYHQYEQEQYNDVLTVPLSYYLGYPTHEHPANLSGQDLNDKEAAFLAYAAYDGGVCHSVALCQSNPAYGAYLDRQYTNPY